MKEHRKFHYCFYDILLQRYRYRNQKFINIIEEMSVTISNCDDICKCPTNSSKSKMLYTFSKESRFPKHRIIMCDKFYDIKPLSTTRTTAFGYGEKYDFTKDVPKSPPPNTYNLKSDFQVQSQKGFGFGNGRSQMEITGPFVQTILDKNPGPGAYELKGTVNNTITYTLGAKSSQEDHEKIKFPGPGSYSSNPSINQKGVYFLSKFKNSCTRSFNGPMERGKVPINRVPGPGSYSTNRIDFSPDGKYYWSKIPSSFVRSFGKSTRSNLARKSDTPGPGNYKLPSQFGHYISKFTIKKPKTQQTGRKNYNQANKQNQVV